MLALRPQDLIELCGPRAAENGRRYFDQGRVVAFRCDGTTIQSSVKGSAATPYRQTITVAPRSRGGVALTGSCTCPVGADCKHVAAALFKAIAVAAAAKPAVAPGPTLRTGLPARSTTPSARGRVGAAPERPALPSRVLDWLDDLGQAAAASSEDFPPDITQRIIYIVRPIPDDPRPPLLGVLPVSAKLLKSGAFGAASQPYVAERAARGAPRFFRAADVRIMRELARLPAQYTAPHYRLADEAGADLLQVILGTGRARWHDLDGPVLAAGPARPGAITWAEAEHATVLPRLDVAGDAVVLAATPPVYVDGGAGLIGPVDTGQPPRVAAAVLRAPPLPATSLAEVGASLARRGPALAGLAPPPPPAVRLGKLAPVPCLRLFTTMLPLEEPVGFGDDRREPVTLARLSFRYGEAHIRLGETRRTVTVLAAGRLLTLERDPAAEEAARRRLLSCDLVPVAELRDRVPRDHVDDVMPGEDEVAWLMFLYEAAPALQAEGWEITLAADVPFRLVRPDGDVTAELREGSGVDWFELHLGVMVDGERIDLVEPILALLAEPDLAADILAGSTDDGEPVFLPLGAGRVMAVPPQRLRPLVEALRDLAIGADRPLGSLRLTSGDAARIADFEAATGEAELTWHGGQAIRTLGRRLNAAETLPPAEAPPGFLATLRPYQADGVSWMALLSEVGLGGILADDMGLGKTVQALAFLWTEKASGRLDAPALVVAPTSLMDNWAREAARFAPGLRVLTLHGAARKALFEAIPEHDLVLTTYPLVSRDRDVLAAQGWSVLLLDEAQTIKNPDAATTKLILSLHARHRFCLTGTPVENNLAELWSLFAFACPGLLGDRQRFAATWRTPIEKTGDAARSRLLARRVRPFLLRRTKEQVAGDLPPKTEIVERIVLPPGQRDVYEGIRLSMHARIHQAIVDKGWAQSRIVVLDALLKLRQACCDPRLLKLRSAGKAGSAKLDRLEEILRELVSEGRRVIVFSQFTTMLDLIRLRLDAAGQSYSLLTGSTRDRPAAIAAFDRGETQVFLVSLKAGGVGLNLVSADTVVLYDPWWNPAVEAQAVDRAHRIGQTRPVFVHKLVAADTIEEKMEVLKEKKAALAASLFDADGAPTLAMTEADIEMLLRP